HALAEGLAAAQDGPAPLPQDSAEPVPVATARPHTGQEPVAIIGIGCAYAGLRGPEQLWETLWHGKELVGKAPRNRYDRTQAAADADAPDDHR
ncbi:beta-ketoacyl synthase N-terminal-like domain-containing protein, partial [Streptococcus agalactiae]|uniref:beta-ketoacyl synthase N-terminal-like domain-containing protein n=1 Tax=Streptococcus agalactiae TaxID=1311 RepID=UPI00300F8E91